MVWYLLVTLIFLIAHTPLLWVGWRVWSFDARGHNATFFYGLLWAGVGGLFFVRSWPTATTYDGYLLGLATAGFCGFLTFAPLFFLMLQMSLAPTEGQRQLQREKGMGIGTELLVNLFLMAVVFYFPWQTATALQDLLQGPTPAEAQIRSLTDYQGKGSSRYWMWTTEGSDFTVPDVHWWRQLRRGQYVIFLEAQHSKVAFAPGAIGGSENVLPFLRLVLLSYLLLASLTLVFPIFVRGGPPAEPKVIEVSVREEVTWVAHTRYREEQRAATMVPKVIETPVSGEAAPVAHARYREEQLVSMMARVREAPENARRWYDLGFLLEGYGDLVKARECYARAMMLNPDLLAARRGWERLKP